MLCPSNNSALQLNKYFVEKVIPRKNAIDRDVREISKVVTKILHEVEAPEPRFISSLNEINGRFEGLTVQSQTEFEVVLYLNQIGVFNFVDDGSIPGCGCGGYHYRRANKSQIIWRCCRNDCAGRVRFDGTGYIKVTDHLHAQNPEETI
ncbi:unnamed protein product [Rotaria sp. Silwood1]|nr:unnamed protein product [Rotaria sp. Silwood1]CAF1611084.1 unnamed protein product [Rotaria sp. Silwood1]